MKMLWIAAGALIVISLWFLSPLIVKYLFSPGMLVDFEELSKLGAVGDTFGVLNSLFTGLALAAIVCAIFIQIAQLKRQDENLDLYKKEVQSTLDHLEKEDQWNKIRLKMDVLPMLTELAEKELRDLLGSDYVEREFYKSPTEIQRIKAKIKEQKEVIDYQRKQAEQAIQDAEELSKNFMEMPEEEQTQATLAYLQGTKSSPKEMRSKEEIKIERCEKESKRLDAAQELLTEIEVYQMDLQRAYADARKSAS